MPALYRSKSFRRFEDNTSRLTDYIEKDSKKVLAAASVQLFISTPQLEKWFKSSTGTVCFLKDLSRRACYYFRLYSLMQGQLWEQEIQSPFTYKKLSYLFHYLTVNRFNYGFKFLCEDEADRFFSVIMKYSSEIIDFPVKTLDSDKSRMDSAYITPANSLFSRRSRRNSAHPSFSNLANSNGITTSTSASSAVSAYSSAKGNSVNSYGSILNSNKSSSRTAYSSERKRKIEKSDISCPFRCSCNDLHVTNTSAIICVDSTKANSDNKSSLIKSSSTFEKNSLSSATSDKHIIENNSNNLIQKYSSIVQRALSSSSSTKNEKVTIIQKEKELLKSKLLSGSASSLNTSSNCSPAQKNIEQKLAHSSNSTNNYSKETKIVESNVKNYIINGEKVELKSCKQTNEELEITKELLIKYNVPINKNIIKVLREYISQYGSVEAFKTAIESSEEKHKLNTFVAASCAAIIGKSYSIASDNSNDSPSKLNRFQTNYPIHNQTSIYISSSTPMKHTKSSAAKVVPAPIMSPFTPILPQSQSQIITNYHLKRSSLNSFQINTPATPANQKELQPQTQSERTPIKTNPLAYMKSTQNRTQTPSPSRHTLPFRQNLVINATPTNGVADAPPKPPRRTSLKVIT